MSLSETIRTRRSVRTFDGNDLKPEDAEKIVKFAEMAENPYDIPITWKVLNAGKHGLSSPVIVGTDTYIAGKLRRVPHAEEAFGYTFEKVVLFAWELGVGTTWIAGTMNRDAFEKAMEIASDEVMPCVSPLGYPAQKMSFRETVMRKGVKAASRVPFEELFFDGSFEKPLTKEAAGKLADALEAVRLAPSAVNKQPWRIVLSEGAAHFYEKRSRGCDDGSWDIQKIDMGIALCHFELSAAACGAKLFFEIRDPELAGAEELTYIATFGFKA